MAYFLSIFIFLSSGIALANHVPGHKAKPAEKVATVTAPSGKKYFTGLLHKSKELKGLGEMHVELADCDNLPEEFDLRKLGTVPDVRDQGQCGSCWSFSKTGSLESAIMASGGSKLDLSEQELVSCDDTQWGCEGGLLSDFAYQIKKGQGKESDFPYTSGSTGSNGRCKQIAKVGKGTSFAYVGAANRSPTLKEVKCALYKSHTVPWITVAAEGNWGQAPSSEDKMFNSCSRGQTNHAIGIVGWKKINGKEGMIIKNSWGKEWGAKGYAVMPLGCDNLGEEVAYIMTDAMPCQPPAIKLPAVVEAYKGTEVMVGVKDNKDWTFDWYDQSGAKIFSGPHLYVTPAQDTVYKLVARSQCGKAESSVKVKVL